MVAASYSDYKQAADDVTRRAKMIFILLIVILICIFIYRVYKGAKSGATAIGDAMGDELLAAQTGVPVTRIKWLRDQAARLNEAVTKYNWWSSWDLSNGTNIDEDAWIQILVQLQTVNECIIISNFYRELKTKTGNGLKTDVDEAFNAKEKARIQRVYPYIRFDSPGQTFLNNLQDETAG
jgi:hypothetical protein